LLINRAEEQSIDGNTKVHFTLSIGYSTAIREDTLTLNDLGYDPKVDTDIDKFLEEQWIEWKSNYIDGSYYIIS
jgi:hypothetical protein